VNRVRETSGLVQAVLEEYGALAQEALEAYLQRESNREHVYRIASDYPLRKGRSLRASFCIAAARAFGASAEDAIRSAVSLELLHSAFLVHDDIEDESEERRGRPALHQLHGVASALNAGDALVVLGLRPLLANRDLLGARVAWRIFEEAERMARETVEGQAMELRWRQENSAGLEERDYLRMTLKKTCWYTTIYPTRVGALIGTRDGIDLDRFMRFGFFLGAAFQIQDDVLNLVGDPARYGKELNGDLLEGKRTLMLIHAMNGCDEGERTRLLRLLALPRSGKPPEEVVWLGSLMSRLGSVEYARTVAHGLAGAALHEFKIAFEPAPWSRDKHFIEALPRWVLERS
jgi:geranylgeranyl diphosphate synthase type II